MSNVLEQDTNDIGVVRNFRVQETCLEDSQDISLYSRLALKMRTILLRKQY